MKTSRRNRLALTCVVTGLVLTACGGGSNGSQQGGNASATGKTVNTKPGSGTPKQGGTLTFLLSSEGAGLDPTMINGAGGLDGNPAMAIYDALVWIDPKDGHINPELAQSIESSDGRTWTLSLRPNVKFSDGTPLDAAAVKYNWERIGDPANKSVGASVANGIASMTVTDSRTLKIVLKEKNGQFPRSMARRLNYIGSPAAEKSEGAGFASKPVGAGPFKLLSWDRGSQMVLERNDKYWDAPRPYVDKVVFKPIADNQQRYDTFNTGNASLMWTNDPQAGASAESNGQYSMPIVMNGGADLAFNTRRAPFNDVRVRKAVAEAIDLDALNASVGRGLEVPAKTLFLPDSPFYDAKVTKPAYDVAAAQKLIDSYVAEKGGPIKFTIGAFEVNRPVAEFIQTQLGQLKNISVSVKTGETAALQQSVAVEHNFDAQIWGVNMSPDPEATLYEFLRSGSSANLEGYSNPALDAALDRGRQGLTDAERKDAYEQAQKIIMSDVPTVFYFHTQLLVIAKHNVNDVTLWAEGLTLFSRLWLS